MFNAKIAKALIASALVTGAVLLPVASAQAAPSAQVYFTNTSDLFGTVDIYVDGVKTASNVFNSTPSAFPNTVGAGTHQFVVTKAGTPLGQQDLLTKTVTIPAGGTYTLAIDNQTNAYTMNTVTGYTLDLSSGNSDGE